MSPHYIKFINKDISAQEFSQLVSEEIRMYLRKLPSDNIEEKKSKGLRARAFHKSLISSIKKLDG